MKFSLQTCFIFLLYKTVLTQEKDGFCQIENPEGKDNSGTIFDFLNMSV